MEIIYTNEFKKNLKKLPEEILELLAYQEEILKKNPFDTRLHTGKLKGGLKGYYSFRITRRYRVIFNFVDEETVIFVTIGHRKEIY